MKQKRKILFMTFLFLVIMLISPFAKVKAADGYLKLNIKLKRSSGYSYQLANSQKNVWKIYNTQADFNDTIYCLKGGPGFGSNDLYAGSPNATEYEKYFNLKQPASIPTEYQTALPTIYKNKAENILTEEYKALIWLLDNCYVAPKSNATPTTETALNRSLLLQAAERYAISEGNPDIMGGEFDYLTDDDIDVVQQLAIWHFTNPEGDPYHVSGSFGIWVTDENGISASLDDDSIENGWDRKNACQALFEYLVETAKEEATSYDITSDDVDTQPVTLEETNISKTEKDDRTVLGPYRINEDKAIEYTLDKIVTDGNGDTITDIILLDRNQDEVESGTSLKDLVGQNFYISIPKDTNTENVTFAITGSFAGTEANYWSVANPGSTDQPVVIVEKKPGTIEGSRPYTEEPVEIFDLALRKFIISIEGQAPEISREPQIATSEVNRVKEKNKLKVTSEEVTASKVHPKNPLVVRKGNKVIYTIRIYNEGNVAGYATEVTDFLPAGLNFVEDSELNDSFGWTLEADKKTVKTAYLKDTLLNPVTDDSTELDFADLQIECEVASTATNETLKNIAEITAHKDIHNNVEVVDRDSRPNSLTENEKNNYGETSKQDDDDFENLILFEEGFDLALRKFIISIDGKAPEESREPRIDSEELAKLKNGEKVTAEKVHPKNALSVKTGDKVIYKIRVYNEGNMAGYATEVTDYLPAGLSFVQNSAINDAYGWSNPSGDGKTIVTNYLADKLLPAFNGTNLAWEDLQIECEVTAKVTDKDQSLKNIAEITEDADEKGNPVTDRDSTPKNVDKEHYGETSQEDDDDFEHLVLVGKYFDLSLRKFITTVESGENKKEYDRAPKVDVTPLVDGSKTTAIYNHPKDPIGVSNGDIVTYTIRVYNEGQIDGYVTEITDHLPPQLEFIVDDELNAKYGWTVTSNDGRTVRTTITSPNTTHSASRDEIYNNRTSTNDKVLLEAFDGKTLNYIDVQIRCKVKDNINLYQKITNIADITDFTDSEGEKVKDRDSDSDGVRLPADTELPNYRDMEIERGDEYILGQQDDDDFEKLVLQRFDLALRKFITGVNENEIKSRVPVFEKVSDTEYKYVHPKDPVEVANGNIVTYTLRIFNEGNIAGYAKEIKDNLPEGLEFLPDNELNKEYRWKMLDANGEETDKVEEAVAIRTDYLSKEQDEIINNVMKDPDRESTDDSLALKVEKVSRNLIKAFNPNTMTMPDYKDVKIAFKVTEPNTSDRIIINTAEITDDSDENGKPVDDIDSVPDNDNEKEDDIDIEKIKVKYFDLSLKKWVTESIVTVNGKTTVNKTGHTGDENPEPPAKVELQADKLSQTTVKFKFNIKVTNEGEIAGYATELIDYIPAGLKYEQKDNPKWRQEDGKVLTNQLKDKLLQPGESATVDIILTWINGKDNLQLKTNWAEIYEDDNEYDSPDIDSTPGNNKKGEDDIDQAPVILSVKTGSAPTYITIALLSASMITASVVLIKKFVI